MASSKAVIENQIKGLFTELWVEFNEAESNKEWDMPWGWIRQGTPPLHYRQQEATPREAQRESSHSLSFFLSSTSRPGRKRKQAGLREPDRDRNF